jgi:membrane fusion protein (multidrug efflux system)
MLPGVPRGVQGRSLIQHQCRDTGQLAPRWAKSAAVWLVLAACAESKASSSPPPTLEVGVVTLQPRTVALTEELPGRTLPSEVSEVRPQVTGIIKARLFTEGKRVSRGETLYQIDERLYLVALAEARANFASARASSRVARVKATRFESLLRDRLVSQLDYADAMGTAEQAAAAVQQAHAALDRAKINLRFTRVPAPISGYIGGSRITAGALVVANQAEPLAVITKLDPILIDLRDSSSQLLTARRALFDGTRPMPGDVRLKLEDGLEYDQAGTLQFAEASVDVGTGSVAIRASFANPNAALLPGMYVRAIVRLPEQPALLAPQAGIRRTARGTTWAFLVSDDGKVVDREVNVSRLLDNQWVTEGGLQPGDRLIVQGIDKVKAGQTVKAIPVSGDVQAPHVAETNGR